MYEYQKNKTHKCLTDIRMKIVCPLKKYFSFTFLKHWFSSADRNFFMKRCTFLVVYTVLNELLWFIFFHMEDRLIFCVTENMVYKPNEGQKVSCLARITIKQHLCCIALPFIFFILSMCFAMIDGSEMCLFTSLLNHIPLKKLLIVDCLGMPLCNDAVFFEQHFWLHSEMLLFSAPAGV